jgi:NAD(P)-dependent dehydrogenase (short-subunit alcohol dehydrogenase family)
MRVAVIGASGTIGKEIVRLLRTRNHDVVEASRGSGTHRIDIQDPASIRGFYKALGKVGAVVSAAGGAAWKPLVQLGDDDFEMSVHYKLMGQVNLVRYGLEAIEPGGSITLTSGVLAQKPMANSSAVSLVNGGLESFTRAAALELQGKVRVNCVSPPWIAETLAAMGQSAAGAMTAAEAAKIYASVVEGKQTGQIVEA